MPNQATLRVVEAVANHFFVEPSQVFGRDRHNAVATVRHVVTFVLREYQHPRPSFPELARELQRGDHTTCMSAVKRAVALAEKDEHVRNAIEVGRLALEGCRLDDEINRLSLLRQRDELLHRLRKVESDLVLDYESNRIGAAE
jgi:hypothetical protein